MSAISGINDSVVMAPAGTKATAATALAIISSRPAMMILREATWRRLRLPLISEATQHAAGGQPEQQRKHRGGETRLPISTDGAPEMKANMQAKAKA